MTGNIPGDVRIIGSVGSADGRGVVRMQDRFDTGIDDLWSALTEPPRLARWIGQVEGDLRLGGEFRAHWFASGWDGAGRVEACEPPRRLVVVTRDDDADYDNTIEVTLSADGDGTVLVAEERGMPLDLVAAYGAGVQIHVEHLADHIAGREVVADMASSDARWKALMPAYQAMPVTGG